MSLPNKLNFSSLKRYDLLVMILLLAALFWVRFHNLEADPPLGLSISTDIFTDPSQYTHFARQQVLAGEFNQFNDYRHVFFLKSAVTVLSLVVFKLLGVSLFSSNLIGLMFSFGALCLFFMIIRRCGGKLAGLFFLLMIAGNYNQIFYGRVPFLEHGMTFFALLAFVFLLYLPNKYGYATAGLALGISIFFCKVIGVVFLAPFGIYFIYKYAYEEKKIEVPKLSLFALGLVAVFVFWLFFSYLPMKEQVSSYIGEQAFSLYGAPEAFDTFDKFVYKFISLGYDSRLFSRMSVPAILTVAFIASLLLKGTERESWKNGFKSFDSAQIFVLAMIVAFYLFLMVWNYRPLRYQLVLIYPFYGAAAIMLSRMWLSSKEPKSEATPYWSLLLIFPLMLVLFNQFYGTFIENKTGEFYYTDYKWSIISGATMITAVVSLLMHLIRKGTFRVPLSGLKIIVIVIIGFIVFKDGMNYSYWNERPTYTARDNGRDLSLLLSDGAVLSGPYAGELALSNEFSTIIHMFGVTTPNPDLFIKYPITHLLLDGSNENQARSDYPILMDSAVHVLTYHVGIKAVKLYRIAGQTGNRIADSYHISPFELMVDKYQAEEVAESQQLAISFIEDNPENMSCYLFLGEAAEYDKEYNLAEMLFKKAVEFSPTNYNLTARLGKFYQDRFDETGLEKYKSEGLKMYDQAILYAPTVSGIKKTRVEFLETKKP